MKLHRFGYKFYLDSSSNLEVREVTEIFYAWIQKQQIEGHLLIDVHDYSHVFQGPGILLAAHEGNFSLDFAGGRPGLLYYRKGALNGEPIERLKTVFRSTLEGCRLLEREDSLQGKIRFRTDEILFLANDRLNAPNTRETYQSLRPALTGFAQQLLGPDCSLQPHFDPRERFEVQMQARQVASLEDLAQRLD